MNYDLLANNRLSANQVIERYFDGDVDEAEHVAEKMQSQYAVPPFWVTEFFGPRAGWRDLLSWRTH